MLDELRRSRLAGGGVHDGHPQWHQAWALLLAQQRPRSMPARRCVLMIARAVVVGFASQARPHRRQHGKPKGWRWGSLRPSAVAHLWGASQSSIGMD